jgi:hypothetical protein
LARFVRQLSVTGGDLKREVAVIEIERPDDVYPPRHLVILPRHMGASFFDGSLNSPIFVNVFAYEAFANSDSINLADGGLEVIDLGGVTQAEDEARKWQMVLPDPPQRIPGR